MKENIERSERIKKYILGEMNADESAAFEKELTQDSRLRMEYEMTKDIAHSVNKLGHAEKIRATLAEEEKGYVKTREVQDIELQLVERELEEMEPQKKNIIDWIKAWFSPDKLIVTTHPHHVNIEPAFESIVGEKENAPEVKTASSFALPFAYRIVVSVAVAAAIAIAVIVPHNVRMAKSGYEESLRILQSDGFITPQSFRGEDEISSMLELITEDMKAGQYADASTRIKITEKEIDRTISSLEGDDSAITRMAELEMAKQELLWYKAILLMNKKEVCEAKKILKQLARRDSSHSEEARRILKEIL